MNRWIIPVSVSLSLLLFAVSSMLSISCGTGGQNGTEPPQDKGRITGVVRDSEENLAPESTPQTYEGALIQVYKAVEAGRYRLAEDKPEQIDYETGELVTEVESGEGGRWEVELEPGKYFIRAFYGDTSYSGDVLIEVKSGEVKKLDLELIHGV
jgi:hypothetical protein